MHLLGLYHATDRDNHEQLLLIERENRTAQYLLEKYASWFRTANEDPSQYTVDYLRQDSPASFYDWMSSQADDWIKEWWQPAGITGGNTITYRNNYEAVLRHNEAAINAKLNRNRLPTEMAAEHKIKISPMKLKKIKITV